MHAHRAKSSIRIAATRCLTLLVLCLAVATSAQAAQINGIADENLEQWGPASWSAFGATGVTKVRH
ncbi:MAG: hypothetical protein ACJ786_39945, partial [Catenulispora sp.]